MFKIAAKLRDSGLALVEQAIRIPARVLGFGGSSEEHVADVAQRLLAIVTLVGAACDEVVYVERRASDDHVAKCRNGFAYHVHKAPDGMPIVESWRDVDRHQ